jgi:hypothetical protein
MVLERGFVVELGLVIGAIYLLPLILEGESFFNSVNENKSCG